MSQAYAQRATGDYLWQVDVDEFYQPAELLQAVCDLLVEQPAITALSFESVFFWAAPDYRVDSWYLRRGAAEFHRLFKWGAGYRYVTHRPPTVVDAQGRDLREAALDPRQGTAGARHPSVSLFFAAAKAGAREVRVLQPGGMGASGGIIMQWADEAYFRAAPPVSRALMSMSTRAACIASRGAHPPQLAADVARPQGAAVALRDCGPASRYRGAA